MSTPNQPTTSVLPFPVPTPSKVFWETKRFREYCPRPVWIRGGREQQIRGQQICSTTEVPDQRNPPTLSTFGPTIRWCQTYIGQLVKMHAEVSPEFVTPTLIGFRKEAWAGPMSSLVRGRGWGGALPAACLRRLGIRRGRERTEHQPADAPGVPPPTGWTAWIWKEGLRKTMPQRHMRKGFPRAASLQNVSACFFLFPPPNTSTPTTSPPQGGAMG